MHCTDAACVKVCPTGALSNNELGFIKYEKDKCCGCGYCAEFCPFEVPQLENNSVTGLNQMNKCTFCVDRVTNGQQPACVEACPVDAIKFGTRADLLEEGKQRVEELKYTNPQACLYGENELGGLHVLYVLPDSPEIYGLPEEPKISLLASVEAKIFRPYAWIVWVAVAAGLAFNILIARKRELSKKEKK
jgi:formate dehydrogenase iron-sulfur subunit